MLAVVAEEPLVHLGSAVVVNADDLVEQVGVVDPATARLPECRRGGVSSFSSTMKRAWRTGAGCDASAGDV